MVGRISERLVEVFCTTTVAVMCGGSLAGVLQVESWKWAWLYARCSVAAGTSGTVHLPDLSSSTCGT